MSGGAERREFQRLKLREPIAGYFGKTEVVLVELGVLGARAELPVRLTTGGSAILSTVTPPLSFDAVVVYEGEGTATSAFRFHAGLRFGSALEGSDVRLRQELTRLVKEEINLARRFVDPAAPLPFDPDETAMRLPSPFITYTHDRGAWRRRGVFMPAQPDDGFTLPETVPADEVRQLSASYEEADDEGRRLIRLFAELHICAQLGVPPVRESVIP